MALTALLLSAGLGTRLRPYTNKLPKPCIPFFGIPLLHYSFYLLRQSGCKDVVINLHHLPHEIRKLTMDPELHDFQFRFSEELEKPYGSGGALYYAQKHLKSHDHFFAINSDEFMVPPSKDVLDQLANDHKHSGALATLLVTDHPDLLKTLKPVWINPQNEIIAFGEKPEGQDVRPVHYTGYKIFRKEVLPMIPEGETHIFHDVLVPAMKKGYKVRVLPVKVAWWETGNIQGLLQAVFEVGANKTYLNYIRDVYKSFHRPFDFEIDFSLGHLLIRHPSVELKGVQSKNLVFLSEDCSVRENSVLDNVILEKGARCGSLQQELLLPGEVR